MGGGIMCIWGATDVMSMMLGIVLGGLAILGACALLAACNRRCRSCLGLLWHRPSLDLLRGRPSLDLPRHRS